MAYDKTRWVNNQTPLNADNLNKLEQGVQDANDGIDQHELEIDNVKDTVYNDHAERISLNETRIEESYSREDNKQDKLISGTNIKTVDGQSLLGSGNISLPEIPAFKTIHGHSITGSGDITVVINADDVPFNGSGTNYLTTKTEVEDSVKELDTKVKANADNVALKVNKSDIVNNLTSTDTNKPLSAKQGKTLQDNKVDKLLTIIGLDLQDNILIGEFRTALGNATQSVAGLLSAEDKTHLDGLVALLETSDGNNVVDTIGEILAIFQNYPEGADLVTALAGKVDKVSGKGLTQNDFTDEYKNKVDGIDSMLDDKVDKNANITAGTHPKITYDAKGLVTAGEDLTTEDIPTHQHTKSEITDFPTIPANKSYSKTITTENWTDKKYAVTISGLVVSDTVLLSGTDDIFTTNGLTATITANTLTFEVETLPTVSIDVNFTVIKTEGGTL